MRTTDPARIEDVHDPIGKLGWPKEKGRDGERTPMQWDAGVHAGFSAGKPWLPIPPSAKSYNVAVESENPDSIFNDYKRLLALRKAEPALRDGEFQGIDDTNEHVFSYLRKTRGETVVVALNMSGEAHEVSLTAAGARGDVLYRSPLGKAGLAAETVDLGHVPVEPFGFVILRVK